MLHKYVIVMCVNLGIRVGVNVFWHCGDDLSQLRNRNIDEAQVKDNISCRCGPGKRIGMNSIKILTAHAIR